MSLDQRFNHVQNETKNHNSANKSSIMPSFDDELQASVAEGTRVVPGCVMGAVNAKGEGTAPPEKSILLIPTTDS